MAIVAPQPAMNLGEQKTLHPFFVKQQRVPSPERRDAPDSSNVQTGGKEQESNCDAINVENGHDRKKRTKKSTGRKAVGEAGPEKRNQMSPEDFTRRPKAEDVTQTTQGVLLVDKSRPCQVSVEEDPNAGRRKRRKTTSPAHSSIPSLEQTGPDQELEMEPSLSWQQQLESEANKGKNEIPVEASSPVCSSPVFARVETPSTPVKRNFSHGHNTISLSPSAIVDRVTTTPHLGKSNVTGHDGTPQERTPKKKVLKISSNGKLISPKPGNTETQKPGQSGRKRGRKPKIAPTRNVTIIQYGSNSTSRSAIGNRIEQIMNGTKPAQAVKPDVAPKVLPKPLGPPKTTHPFFLGKAAQKQEDSTANQTVGEVLSYQAPKTPRRRSAVTPGKLRAEAQAAKSPHPFPTFGTLSGDHKMMKHPGAAEPPWPLKHMMHVRNLEGSSLDESYHSKKDSSFGTRKLKNNVIIVSDAENLIINHARQLHSSLSQAEKTTDHCQLQLGPSRIPERLLTTGIRIQESARREASARLSNSSIHSRALQLNVHPMLRRLYDGIEDTLTPFDKGECEPQSWTHKYSPQSAAEVLQPGREATVLRDWLKSLTVMSVDSGIRSNDRTESKERPKKKRKKLGDDFIVSDDEADVDMDELTDPEDLGRSESRHPKQRSLVSTALPAFVNGDRQKIKNVVLLSGPHGCGKSATVYAVAKEMGFEVFEINPGSRRSGKDIMDKVGDMTENHLVNHKSKEIVPGHVAPPAENVEQKRLNEAFQKDMDSGKQGTMTSFFKSSTQATPRPKAKPREREVKKATPAMQAAQSTLSKPKSQHQKQSLILLEEVDILFEEDQQFWEKVLKLAVHSKRPIIMTCNDEAFVSMHALQLHAVLRFSPPSQDLATDYLLLVAAREGHVLKREAVANLYKSRNYDLRASITELDFWCQMSVGGSKGGLEWIYQRWPPGKDVDEHGRVLRVASRGTYQSGMGWYSHDVLSSLDHVGFDKEEELYKEAWEHWSISPDCWGRRSEYASGDLTDYRTNVSSQRQRIKNLKYCEESLDFMSAADVYCRVDLPESNNDLTDPTLPSIADKERLNYTLAMPLLQLDHKTDFDHLDTSLAVRTHLGIQRTFPPIAAAFQNNELMSTHVASTDADFATKILTHRATNEHEACLTLSRPSFSSAFDVLAEPPQTTLATPTHLSFSSFDGPFRVVVLDLAPYVRSIVAHEMRLEEDRVRLSNLLSERGRRSKKVRMTRASRSALEGGRRETKRRERWFDKALNMKLVMETAGRAWSGLGSLPQGDDMGETESAIGTQRESSVDDE